jgi:hypothetical protein
MNWSVELAPSTSQRPLPAGAGPSQIRSADLVQLQATSSTTPPGGVAESRSNSASRRTTRSRAGRQLQEKGVLTAAEFQEEKKRILGG